MLKKFKPTDIMAKVEIKNDIKAISMKRYEDPETLFTQMSAIEQRYKVDMDLEEKLGVILDRFPKEYLAVLTAEQRQKDDDLTIEDLEEAMTQHFCTLQFGKEDDSDIDNDNELRMSAFGKMCHYCKKKGHFKKDCNKLKKN